MHRGFRNKYVSNSQQEFRVCLFLARGFGLKGFECVGFRGLGA